MMEENKTINSNLLELSTSDYRLTEGEQNIKGWKVRGESGSIIGEVNDLLFDPENNVVRYILVTLKNMGNELDEKPILIPIGLGNLHDNVVIVPDFHTDQLHAMPLYIKDEVTHQLEDTIRDVIGSPAALRMEEKMTELDRKSFYDHHHFDRNRFMKRTDTSNQGISSDADSTDRVEERKTIHELIDQSKIS
ncbi:PRC-barrel domain-containing protein [Pedobacter sp. GR22-10]|uniref:PRC-barrel domain-containing protein n=1 Tax=Pedobacter sp. GR22-10 TaxID=2994472 RepID=UPI002245DBFB|nr:PRC-barrel domain-containing protein [Pedobacter sp. GR22-10]MCX2429508.1 PRC-barrel domain-containing protein [Pedobacter sp. GR22-10]